MPAKDGRRAYEFTLAPGVCAFLGNNFEGRVWAESSRWVGECQSYVAGAGGKRSLAYPGRDSTY